MAWCHIQREVYQSLDPNPPHSVLTAMVKDRGGTQCCLVLHISLKLVFSSFQVTDHEVECDPKFRLFLHTTSEPQTVPHQLAAYTSTLFYQQSRQCIEEELLDTFMVQEKARLENESSALRQVSRISLLLLL